ncbi:MAG: nickel-dependent lactate racemase, partial [Elusimicrobiota bacterium]
LMRSYRFHDHDCSSDNVLLGKMSTGTDLWVNEAIAHADYIISTGNIAPHTFAGFSGGRKGILPGVCGKDTIDANHAKVCRPGVGMGMLENNPIHLEMEEAAEKVGLQFIVNVVRNDKKEVVQVVAGDWKEAFAVGVAKAREVYGYEFKHRSDVVIASSGGFPKDTSLYHAQLAFTAMSGIVNKNGTLVLVAECANGAGQKVFAKTMAGNTVDNILLKKETEIPVGVHRAYLSAKILKDIECILVSSMEKKVVESMHFRYAKTIDDALSMVRKKHGDNYAAYVVPNGSYILPIIK